MKMSLIFKKKTEPSERKIPEPRRSRSSLNGFEEFGGYMAAKRMKLDNQFNKNTSRMDVNNILLFQGISVYINGYTQPPEPELRELFIRFGGTIHCYPSSSTTYVIASNLSNTSKRLYGTKTVKPDWVTESIAEKRLLNYRNYLLYDLNREQGLATLSQFMKKKNPSKPEEVLITPEAETHKELVSLNRPGSSSSTVHAKGKLPVKMAREKGFIEEFFKNSRLHLISSQKKEMQNYIADLRSNGRYHRLTALEELKKEISSDPQKQQSLSGDLLSPGEKVIFHIDMDCFFVSVGRLSRPHLMGKPIVVTHSSGKSNSYSDVACASYEARKFGVKNGMWVHDAKQLCPSLQVIPYDFDDYKRVSKTFYDTVARLTLDIEPSSVDEMILDATLIIEKCACSPEVIGEFIRKKIKESTGCNASVGVGSNKLLAYIAVSKAKPDGYFQITHSNFQVVAKELSVRKLPGIGRNIAEKLKQYFNVASCDDLSRVSLSELKYKLGDGTGLKVFNLCRGLDTSQLKLGHDRPKNISVDVNYGIRFYDDDNMKWDEFLFEVCKELNRRAMSAQASGFELQLRILTQKKGVGIPLKHGGTGIVDTSTRSTQFKQPINNSEILFKSAKSLLRMATKTSTKLSEYRGIGLTLSKLRFSFDKSGKSKNVQASIFDIGKKKLPVKISSVPQSVTSFTNDSTKSSPTEQSSNLDDDVVLESPSQSSINETKSPKSPSMSLWNVADNLSDDSHTSSKSRSFLESALDDEKIEESFPRYVPMSQELFQLNDDYCRLPCNQIEYQKEFPESQQLDDSSSPKSDLPEVQVMEVHKTPATENARENNPYAEVDSINSSYLDALPEAIRAEVLNDFYQSKNQTNINDGANHETNNIRKNLPSTSSCMRVSYDDKNGPSKSGVTENNQSSNSSFSKAVSEFWDPSNKKIYCPIILASERPMLNGKSSVHDVRNLIWHGINNIESPAPKDFEFLKQYFKDLLQTGFLLEVHILLKSLKRYLANSKKSRNQWYLGLNDIVHTIEEQVFVLHKGKLT